MSKDLEPVRRSIAQRQADQLRNAEHERTLPGPRPFNWDAWRSNRAELIHRLRTERSRGRHRT